jgi:acyl-CoA reductase-like NAD-dependent aldehyde dehydrogenase
MPPVIGSGGRRYPGTRIESIDRALARLAAELKSRQAAMAPVRRKAIQRDIDKLLERRHELMETK